jgi:uncharacterized protein YqjF (DUF2071 family)
MRQTWRELLFLHWPFRREELRPLIPPQLELDLFEETAYVGLVAFTMTGVRPPGLPPVWRVSSFHETNVRTYVHREGRDPGVWFFSLDAASALAVRAARRWFHLPYHHARMLLEKEPVTVRAAQPAILYAGVRRWPGPVPASYAIRATPMGAASPALPGTIEHFLVERYLLYTLKGGRLVHGRVHHTPYPLQTATVHALDETLLLAAGLTRPDTAPVAHFANGVSVRVFGLRPGSDASPA